MSALPWHPSQGPYVDVDLDELLGGVPGDDVVAEADAEWVSDRADCCVATAAYRVVLPATAERRGPAELLLCGHHTRTGWPALARLNAAVFDGGNRLVASADLAG
jgi:hypothetical protein